MCPQLYSSENSSRGWPGFPDSSSPFRNCGCPVLAFFARAGTMLPVLWVSYAQWTASYLRCPSPALYHLLVLPALAFSSHRLQPRPPALDSGTDSAALPLRGCRLCGHARAHSSTLDGAGGRNSLDRDAGVEATHGPRTVTQMQAERPAPAQFVSRPTTAQSILAGALLRLQCLDDEEAHREAEVYAPQSGESRVGGKARAMALEQLSLLPSRRGRTGAGE